MEAQNLKVKQAIVSAEWKILKQVSLGKGKREFDKSIDCQQMIFFAFLYS